MIEELKELGLLKWKDANYTEAEGVVITVSEQTTNNNELGQAKRSTCKAGLVGANVLRL